MKNLIEETLKENIKDINSCFVFSTQMAADLWADRATLVCNVNAVAMERFIAWDTFKSKSIKSKQKDKKSIPSIMRRIFVTLLLAENKNKTFLKKIIKPEFANETEGFISWITSFLPSLSLWKKYIDENKFPLDEEDKDFLEIYNRYSTFLDKNNFFDPAWETPPFQSDGNKYFIFFPEIFSDYIEYKDILENTKDIKTISLTKEYLPSIDETEKLPKVSFWNNSLYELKNVALKLRELHEQKGINWEDIAISVPDINTIGRYLERELELNRIPHVLKFAKPLNSTGAGNLFTQILECVSKNWTFETIRDLLLNLELPWKDKESINQLIEFGKSNNCICSYTYNGKEINIWEESYKTTTTETRAMEFFRSLKKHLTALVMSKSFTEIQTEYFKFRNFAFNMENCNPSTDKIISRCISELSNLIDIEEEYPEYKVSSPFSFWTSQLSQINYLEQTENLGVRVLSYKTAVCAPFACHIIINASQNALSVIYKPLSFLREDKRKKILKNYEDPNVTQHFIMLYAMNSISNEVLYSASSKTWTGYSQVCSYLNEHEIKQEEYPISFYDKEKEIFDKDFFNTTKNIKELSDISKHGFNFWKDSQNFHETKENDNVLSTKINEILDFKIKDKNNKEKIRISASSLKKFYNCPRDWLENRIANIDESKNEATLMDNFAQGRLNHKILELYFKELRKNELIIHTTESGLTENYLNILKKAVDDAIIQETKTPINSKGNSFIATELIKTTKQNLLENMIHVIESFSSQFEGFSVFQTEKELSYEDADKDYILNGKIDLVLSDDEQLYIIDFKTSKAPNQFYENGTIPIKINNKKNDSSKSEESDDEETEDSIKNKEDIPDFQMPSYIYLLEKNLLKETEKFNIVENCAFFSIKEKKIIPVAGEKIFELHKKLSPKSKQGIVTREAFEPTINVFIQKVDEFYNKIKSLDFSVTNINQDFSKCNSCTLRAICRRVFNISKKD